MADDARDGARYGKTPVIEIGQRFGRLSVLARLGRINRTTYWYCRCDCGELREVRHGQLQSGKTRSCGCLLKETRGKAQFKHGLRNSPEWKAWSEARSRCRPDSSKRKWYADRGITVCPEWQDDFSAFYAHMGPKPAGTSLDRIDNAQGYKPGNCRWATKVQQANNTTYNRIVEAFGQSLTVAQWARKHGFKPSTLARRISSGESPERALTLGLNESKLGLIPWNKGKTFAYKPRPRKAT